jgi:hypothetical protein
MRSGFESTGLYPFNVERALSKLPKENRTVETEVQQQLLKWFNDIRYNPPPTTHAHRPKKNEKLPAGERPTPVPVLWRVRRRMSLFGPGE